MSLDRGADHHRERSVDQRDDDADARESAADRREREQDARERVLDRWERALAARATDLHLLDDDGEQRRVAARDRRQRELMQRRDDAETRRDAAIEREIRRGEPGPHADAGSTDPNVGAAPDSVDRFAPLARALQGTADLEPLLLQVLAAALDVVSGCDAASVALELNGQLETAASTAEWAADLDATQIAAGCGPLPSAMGGDVVSTADMTRDDRWPALAALHDTTTAHSALSYSLAAGGVPAGVLTLYSRRADGFQDEARRVGDILAAHAAVALDRTLERLTHQAQADAWQRALESRDVIGQAKGILMQQRSIGADDAFKLLRQTSQRLNVKVRDIAEHVVSEHHLPGA